MQLIRNLHQLNDDNAYIEIPKRHIEELKWKHGQTLYITACPEGTEITGEMPRVIDKNVVDFFKATLSCIKQKYRGGTYDRFRVFLKKDIIEIGKFGKDVEMNIENNKVVLKKL